jgi:hypothetical protein
VADAIVGQTSALAEESPVSREEKLMKAVIAMTGDSSITDVAEFNPKGSAGASAAGATAGSLAGGAVTGGDSWGRSFGAAGGAAAGRAMMGLSEDLPPRICVAVSPDEIYLFGMRAMGYHLDPLAKIHRDKLGVEIHQRVSVRTVVLEDLETGHKFPLEVKRLNLYHAKAMVELLMMSDAHHEDEIEEEEESVPSDAG